MRIKNFHEAPKQIFRDVQALTSGDYALVHLFEEDPEYLRLFIQAVAEGREVILDNSVFELGVAFDALKFANWVELLRPTWYIVPDVLEDAKGTVDSFKSFVERFPTLPGGRVGVVQGKNFEECLWCYEQLEPHCDMIAFSFDLSMYHSTEESSPESKWNACAVGRVNLIRDLRKKGVINVEKPHHLLGVALPQEITLYHWLKDLDFIYSVDTSNPVIAGIQGLSYTEEGLKTKPVGKLFEMINYRVNDEQWSIIKHNIETFRGYCGA